MLDVINREQFPSQTDILCFWCKHSFTTRPLGCPIKFINNRIEKAYVSQITKDKYFMKENVTLQKLSDITGKKIYNTSSTEIKTIDTLGADWKPYNGFKPEEKDLTNKEQSKVIDNYEVWSDKGKEARKLGVGWGVKGEMRRRSNGGMAGWCWGRAEP